MLWKYKEILTQYEQYNGVENIAILLSYSGTISWVWGHWNFDNLDKIYFEIHKLYWHSLQ